MAESIRINTEEYNEEFSRKLKVGDSVLITGKIYSARDAAHKVMTEALARGEKLPIDWTGRMDAYTPTMLDQGIKGMIGKGSRKPEVVESMKKNGCTYFAAVGGAAALIAKSIKKYEVLAYGELGPEALAELTVEDFPCIVVGDTEGNNFYELGQKPYRKI
ncbi:MAG: fumarate hydratase C-terminal domain-containing protein [Veillonella sp.]|nr:fumarate hydratase C-terminal domain-containing protein [Veillonella sp.]